MLSDFFLNEGIIIIVFGFDAAEGLDQQFASEYWLVYLSFCSSGSGGLEALYEDADYMSSSSVADL